MTDSSTPGTFKAFLAKTGAAFLLATLAAGIFLFGIPLNWSDLSNLAGKAPTVISAPAGSAEDAPTTATLAGSGGL